MPINHAQLARHPVIRWSAFGGGFAVLGLSMLHVFFVHFGWPYWLATALQSEICALLRFLANDRWVFGHARPTWKRLAQYHAASALGFVVYWCVANTLQRQGLHHLVAPILAAGCSFGVSLASNFLWVWRKRSAPAAP